MSMRWRIFLSFLLVILVAVGALAFFAYRSTTREVSTFVTSGGLWGWKRTSNNWRHTTHSIVHGMG